MNAIEDNKFSRAWAEAGAALPKPAAILAVSAHWVGQGVSVTSSDKPSTIYDFGGFPRELYEISYPAPGSPALAGFIRDLCAPAPVALDPRRGLDHGAWSVLCRMFPDADLPVVQLSLDMTRNAAGHFELAKRLKPLRRRGVLIVATGNIVHNLGRMAWDDTAFDWAVDFDEKIRAAAAAGDVDSIIHYDKWGEAARLAVPEPSHFWPLLYALAVREKDEPLEFFSEKVTLGSMSMRSLRIG